MNKKEFGYLLDMSTKACIAFAGSYLTDSLPAEASFRVYVNQSYDGNPLEPDEKVYPEDSLVGPPGYRVMTSAEVVDFLWRDGKVPEWINVELVAVTQAASIIRLSCCGRFSNKEERLYYAHQKTGPFGIKQTLPPWYRPGDDIEKFSLSDIGRCDD